MCDAGRTIPRAVIGSVFIVAAIYLMMNLAIIGVIPWQEAMRSEHIGVDFIERLFGSRAAAAFAWLIIWTALAGTFAMTLGYSRIAYAAARGGDFFGVFAWLDPVHRYPAIALVAIAALTAVACFFPLEQVIDAAVVVRIAVQFIGQIAALHVLRTARPDTPLPFRMWLYPLPALIALLGWLFILSTRSGWMLRGAAAVVVSGCVVYIVWRHRSRS